MPAGAIVFKERVRVPADVFSLARFRAWAHSRGFPESGWVSYIGGEIEVEMSPEELETHNKVKVCLSTGIAVWIEKKNLGELLGDRAFLVNEQADLATEPDLMFSSWASLRSGQVRYAERKKGSKRYVEVVGTPDLVVEVVSDFTVRKDTVLLRNRYYRAGIPEYWLVDARKAVAFKILRRGRGEYVEVRADADGYRASTVLGRASRITRKTNPVGAYSYRLLSR